MPKGVYIITEQHRKNLSKSLTGRIFSKQHRMKLRKAKLGKIGVLSNNYIKDRAKLKKNSNKMLDSAYMNWSHLVKKRDLGKCRLLNNECKGRLEAHHIYSWRNYPELRYLLTNGITLCQFHHPRGDEKEKRMIPIFQELLSISKD